MRAATEDLPERIAVAGAGVAGAWLYRTLTELGRSVEIYDLPARQTACGLHPCAWGVGAEFFHLTGSAPESSPLVTNRVGAVDFEGRRFPAEVWLIDKPRLVRGFLDGARVNTTPIPAGEYDRILDCTGAARAYLPATETPDRRCATLQTRVHAPDLADDTILIRYANGAYCWAFPLGGHRFHVGAGDFFLRHGDPGEMLRASGLLDGDGCVAGEVARQFCRCESTVRITGPAGARPHVAADPGHGCSVWGVGESIGTVSPVTGEGIAHALRCAQLYLEHEADPAAYSVAVCREFAWMDQERRILDRALAGRWISGAEWRILQRNAASMGIHMDLRDVLAVVGRMLVRRRIHLTSLVPRPRLTR